MEKEQFLVKSNMRFLFAKTSRIYDPGDVFDAGSQADFDYLTLHKLVNKAPKDAEITETEQDKAERIAAGLDTEGKKLEAIAEINKLQEGEEVEEKPAKKAKSKK